MNLSGAISDAGCVCELNGLHTVHMTNKHIFTSLTVI